jgi:hypothetical protein
LCPTLSDALRCILRAAAVSVCRYPLLALCSSRPAFALQPPAMLCCRLAAATYHVACLIRCSHLVASYAATIALGPISCSHPAAPKQGQGRPPPLSQEPVVFVGSKCCHLQVGEGLPRPQFPSLGTALIYSAAVAAVIVLCCFACGPQPPLRAVNFAG